MRLVSIDPGIDVCGLCAFEWRLERTPVSFDEAVGALLEVHEITTAPDDELPTRLASLGLQATSFLRTWDPLVVVVEVPAFHGSYTGGRERRQGVNKLYQALGAILSRTGARTLSVPAPRIPKAQRHRLLEHAARMAKVELPYGARGAKREDVWDAIWIGAQALTEGRYLSLARRVRGT